MSYKQRGQNEKYPVEVEIWRLGDKVPEWLSDRARIKFIDGEGNMTLDRRDHGSGGFEIISADGIHPLVNISERDGVVCFGDGRIFGLRKRQFEILYWSMV